MRIVALVSMVCALVSATVSLAFLSSTKAQEKYWLAHDVVEKIAVGEAGTEDLPKAVSLERVAEKNLYLHRDLGTKFVWVSTMFTLAALVFSLPRPKMTKTGPNPENRPPS
jgi:hypothetical protein